MTDFEEYVCQRIEADGYGLHKFDTDEKVSLICAYGLQGLGIKETDSVLISHFAKKYLWEKEFKLKYKVVNDPIHSTIKLHPVAVRIMDTEQFQRLRRLKQLGVAEYVFPGATHSRFEHSIGAYHLAGVVMDHLMTNQPNLEITEKDKLCVQLAALCRDLGHAPFSRLFKEAMQRKYPSLGWTYENVSIEIVEKIYNSDNFFWETWGIENQDIAFITALISPERKQTLEKKKPQYLFDIVNNKDNGVDVHKFEAVTRDSMHLGIGCKFEYTRLVPFMRAIKDGICIRDKLINVLDDLFSTRYDLHAKAYQHPVSVGIELMLVEAFASLDNLEGYALETDESIFHTIMSLPVQNEFTELVRSVKRRIIWRFVGYVKLSEEDVSYELNNDQVESQMKERISEDYRDNLKVAVSKMHFSSDCRNPFQKIKFFSRLQPDREIQKLGHEVKRDILNTRYNDQIVFVFSKVRDEEICGRLFRHFERWCTEQGLPQPYST